MGFYVQTNCLDYKPDKMLFRTTNLDQKPRDQMPISGSGIKSPWDQMPSGSNAHRHICSWNQKPGIETPKSKFWGSEYWGSEYSESKDHNTNLYTEENKLYITRLRLNYTNTSSEKGIQIPVVTKSYTMVTNLYTNPYGNQPIQIPIVTILYTNP